MWKKTHVEKNIYMWKKHAEKTYVEKTCVGRSIWGKNTCGKMYVEKNTCGERNICRREADVGKDISEKKKVGDFFCVLIILLFWNICAPTPQPPQLHNHPLNSTTTDNLHSTNQIPPNSTTFHRSNPTQLHHHPPIRAHSDSTVFHLRLHRLPPNSTFPQLHHHLLGSSTIFHPQPPPHAQGA